MGAQRGGELGDDCLSLGDPSVRRWTKQGEQGQCTRLYFAEKIGNDFYRSIMTYDKGASLKRTYPWPFTCASPGEDLEHLLTPEVTLCPLPVSMWQGKVKIFCFCFVLVRK